LKLFPSVALQLVCLYNCTSIVTNFFQNSNPLFSILNTPLTIGVFRSRHTRQAFLQSVADTITHRWPIIFCIFLPWYLWSLSYFPEISLWWVAFPLSIILVTVSLLWRRSIIYWLPPIVLLFNTIYFWLPWPGVKLAYLGPAAACFVMGLSPGRYSTLNHRRSFSFGFGLLLLCLTASSCIGILSHFIWQQSAAWHELFSQIRLIPLLGEKSSYIPLRYLWTWSLAIGTYFVLLRLLRRRRDIHILLWLFHILVIPIALLGIYSYVSGTLMVGTYQYEHRINASMSSPAVLADILTFILISGLYLFKEYRSRAPRIFLAVIMALELVLIILSGCRVNLVILLLLFGIWLVRVGFRFFKHRSLAMRVTIILLFATCIAGWFALPASTKTPFYSLIQKVPVIQRMKEWQHIISNGGAPSALLSARLHHWRCALNMIHDYPAWGVGCGMFEQYYVDYRLKQDLFHYARVHNVLLRICAEGGFITFSAFLVFLTGIVRSILLAFRSDSNSYRLGWLRCVKALSLALCILGITALSSDILYENVESIMFLAIVAACLSRACAALQSVDPYSPSVLRGTTRFGILPKAIIILLIFILFSYGVSTATKTAKRLFAAGTLTFGLSQYNPPGEPKGMWRRLHRNALTGFHVTKPVMYFSYRALNDRMAQQTNTLTVYINNNETVSVAIDTKESRTIYFDMTALSGSYCSISWNSPRAYIPWKEHWFKHPDSFSALLTLPHWLEIPPAVLLTNEPATWCIFWSKDPTAYRAQGFTSTYHTVTRSR
jgi:hypothetical protein